MTVAGPKDVYVEKIVKIHAEIKDESPGDFFRAPEQRFDGKSPSDEIPWGMKYRLIFSFFLGMLYPEK